MQATRTSLIALAAVVAGASCVLAGSDASLTWSGPATGGNWTNAANWTVISGGITAEEAMSRECTWTFGSSLADGAVVTNTSTALRIGHLTYDPGSAKTLRLVGTKPADPVFGSACQVIVNKPGTLEWGISLGTVWKLPGDNRIICLGGGTINFAPEAGAYLYRRDIQPCSGTTVRFGSAVNFASSYMTLWNSGSLAAINADAKLGWIADSDTSVAGLKIENGHTLTLTSGENAYSGAVPFKTPVTGEGNITFYGGNDYAFSGAFSLTGLLSLYNSSVDFGSLALPKTVALACNENGAFTFGAAQSLGVIKGGGATGGIRLADGANLTVGGDGATTNSQFDARISGKADVTKAGADYTLTLTGDNAWTGATRVAAGTLAITRKTVRPGLVARWTFDDPNDLGANAAGTGVKLSFGAGTGSSYGATHGVNGGGGLRLTSGSGVSTAYATVAARNTTVANGFSARNAPFSYSFWFKPDLGQFSGQGYVLRRGGWSAGNNFMLWLNKSKEVRLTCDSYGKTDDSLNIYRTVPDVGDGNWHHFAITYGNRHFALWYDGKLLGETTTSKDISFPKSDAMATISFGEQIALGNNYTSSDHHVGGDFDDFCVWNRELTATDVAREYALGGEAGETVLPQPLARWRFDDADDVGKDDLGLNPLVKNPEATKSSTPAAIGKTGAIGKTLNAYAAMTTATGTYPVGMPIGEQPYSISIRVLANSATEHRDIFAIGDCTNAQKTLHFGYHNCPRRFGVTYSSIAEKNVDLYSPVATESGSQLASAWVHYIITCNPGNYVMRLYRDGRLDNQTTTFWTNLPADGTLCLNWRRGLTAADCTPSLVDDLQIFDYELTPDDARVLAQSLATGQVGPVLPPDSPVTVEAGATFAVEGRHAVSNAVSGAGRVLLKSGATFGAADWTGFTGTVEGVGRLLVGRGQTLPMTAQQVACDVTFDGGEILLSREQESQPLVKTSGTLYLPVTGHIGRASGADSLFWDGGEFMIAACAAYVGPADTSNWTIETDDPKVKGKFVFRDGVLYLRMNRRGLRLIVR